jgi:hypothetical protein
MATDIWSYCYVVLTVYLDENGAERSRTVLLTECTDGVTNDPRSPLPTVLRWLGERGWEMVGIASFPRVNTEETHYYFKKSEKRPARLYDDDNPPPVLERPIKGRS